LTSERGGRVLAGPGVRPFELGEHNCFACGSLNEHGLQLVLHVEPGCAWTELELERRFEGWSSIAHGGIVATILDEVMAWALVGDENWGLTARMSIDFKRPVPLGRTVRAEGRVERSRRRIVETSGRLIDAATGETLATATATYVAADPERRRELQARYGFRFTDAVTPDPVASR
jgi:acyl-coenzyme A thioesterase PaaI-like protein